MKTFNTAGTCRPNEHYMVDITERLEIIRGMVAKGDYFCINRGRWGTNNGNGWYLATDDVWSSIEGNPDVRFKYQPKMYINLSSYVKP